MSNQIPPEGNGEGEDDTLDSSSSNEDTSSSNSDEEPPSTNGRKIRRTVSEPTMMRADDVMMMSPTRKLRVRTFVEGGQSPTRIPEDLEADDSDAIWIDGKETGDDKDASGETLEARISGSVPDCLRPEHETSLDAEMKLNSSEGRIVKNFPGFLKVLYYILAIHHLSS